jgi:hypothetical protein
MSKRSRRIAKKNELQAVEEAIGSSLGKNPAGGPKAGKARPEDAKPARRNAIGNRTGDTE